MTLGAIAEIEDGQQEEENAALVNGQRALSIDIIKAQGENTIAVVDGVRRVVKDLQGFLPAGREDRDRARRLHRHPQLGRRREEDAARRRRCSPSPSCSCSSPPGAAR